ncbi:MAG: pyridoxamine 5'-phosphate oxidase family protein [Pseudonocardia sp.]|nr:pyridoxamine 5'-phosphate oxidase family protein [Pseudonocardia sp.]
MATWNEIESAVPEFAARVRAVLDAHKHKTIATLRADGSPRISGIEVRFDGDHLTFGSMPGARKGADLRRDPRFALHSASVDPPDGGSWAGDAKVSGRAVYVGPLDGDVPGDLFRADLDDVVLTGLNDEGTALVIETWRSRHGLRRVERA